jgi:arginine decarboxylase
LAGIGAVVKTYDKVLIARNCHKSVYNAINLYSLEPIYIYPKKDELGIDLGITKSQIEEEIKRNKDIKLVVLTSPTYEGIISNIKEIVDISHEFGVPVLVDEAHGAHLNFVEELKEKEALNSGADIVIQSLHKTLPAMTQCAIMHIQGEFIKENDVERKLDIFETSSPSYVLMSSIDECLEVIETRGEVLFNEYKQNLKEFYEKTKKLKNLIVLDKNKEFQDKGKIVVITKMAKISGKQLSDILRIEYHIEVEMANVNYIIAMTSICDKHENFERLIKALFEIDEKIENEIQNEEEIFYDSSLNEMQNIPNGMGFVNYKEAIGKVSKEYIWIYPPGIPIIIPGEVIKEETIYKIEEILKAGIEVKTSFNQFPMVKVV